ncbi:Uncharacterized transporter [Sparassis crispa]|uniref:Uncharacterized transporter n=1 Tax=Sparassis crispa TaxID=139825 RepID=A0A401GH17_9APHY|nr:Uncharacterized transporter [Sparassis crispa]GBE81470.1 Uncharacterized transporter [Sparassis crispa]
MANERIANGYTLVDSDRDVHEHEFDLDVHLASLAEKRRLWWRNALINTFFIASWFVFATVLSVYNKWMFAPEHFGFPSPLFVTTLHMMVQFLLATLLRLVWPRRFRPELSPSKLDYLRKAVPTGITTSLDIGLSNLSLKMITLSFYTMCKSSSLIFVLLFAFLFRLERFSFILVGVIALICVGVLLMVATETHFVLPGFILIMSASALGGFRWSLTQLLLRSKNMGFDSPVATLFWLAPIMAVTLGSLTLIVDGWSKIFSNHFFSGGSETLRTCFFLISPGVVAFCMVLSEFYILQRAGVVPMSIAGIAKEVTTITISAWVFGDELTPLNITGVAVTACGIALYTYHKYRKSMDASVPLDAHGNPVEDVGEDCRRPGELENGHINLEETLRLAVTAESRASLSDDSHPEHAARTSAPELLFDVGSEDDESHSPAENTSRRSDPSQPPSYVPDASQDMENVWGK